MVVPCKLRSFLPSGHPIPREGLAAPRTPTPLFQGVLLSQVGGSSRPECPLAASAWEEVHSPSPGLQPTGIFPSLLSVRVASPPKTQAGRCDQAVVSACWKGQRQET